VCFLLNDSHPLHKSMFWVAQQKRKKNNKPMSKIRVKCGVFEAYLISQIPKAFDKNRLLNTNHKDVKALEKICVDALNVKCVDEIPYFENLVELDLYNNKYIENLPRLPNTLKRLRTNHEFRTTAQESLFYEHQNFVRLDNGNIVWLGCRTFDVFDREFKELSSFPYFFEFINRCRELQNTNFGTNYQILPTKAGDKFTVSGEICTVKSFFNSATGIEYPTAQEAVMAGGGITFVKTIEYNGYLELKYAFKV
jgi:hypothetical protein